jgi:hypothetical protein
MDRPVSIPMATDYNQQRIHGGYSTIVAKIENLHALHSDDTVESHSTNSKTKNWLDSATDTSGIQ